MKFTHYTISIAVLLFATTIAHAAHEHHTISSNDNAPIGVMGDHQHTAGSWMVSYRYNRMEMDGNRTGTTSTTTAEVLDHFMVAPLDMQMEMHMLGAMYGVSDKLTIMGMVPYIEKSMDHINRMGMRFNTQTDGIGDAKLSAIYSLYDSGTHERNHYIGLNLGVSLPTGSIDERGNTPAGTNQKLPYPMQLGSGTFDPMLGLTYVQQHQNWSFGTQLHTTLRFGENDENYRLGHEYKTTAWAARNLTDHLSLSLRLENKIWGNVEGQDPELNPMMVPTTQSDLRGGERMDALIGLNFTPPSSWAAGQSFGVEFGVPIYQDLNGPQLETDYHFILGARFTF